MARRFLLCILLVRKPIQWKTDSEDFSNYRVSVIAGLFLYLARIFGSSTGRYSDTAHSGWQARLQWHLAGPWLGALGY